MPKYIAGVRYGRFTTAYLKIIAQTQRQAERYAKRVGSALLETLPETAMIGVARVRPGEAAVLEIPIIIGECERPARAVLSSLVLRGSV